MLCKWGSASPEPDLQLSVPEVDNPACIHPCIVQACSESSVSVIVSACMGAAVIGLWTDRELCVYVLRAQLVAHLYTQPARSSDTTSDPSPS
jgi:hypothetical protein